MIPEYHQIAQTVAINVAVAGPTVIFTPDADKRFVVTKWFLMPTGAVTATFQSSTGPVAITGAIPMQANTAYQDGNGDEAVLIGRANGDALQLLLGGAVQIDGYVVVGQLQE